MLPTEASPLSTLLLIWAAGGVASVEDNRLVVRGAVLCDELREAIRHNRDALVSVLRPADGKEAA